VSKACKKHVENTRRLSSVLLTKLDSLSLSDRSNSSNASSRVCLTWFTKPCCFSNEYLTELCRIETGKPVNASVTMKILWANVSEILLSSLISASSSGSYCLYSWQLSMYNHLVLLDLIRSKIEDWMRALFGSYTSPKDTFSSSILFSTPSCSRISLSMALT